MLNWRQQTIRPWYNFVAMCTCGLKNIQKLCWFSKTPKTDQIADLKYDLIMQVAWNTRNFIPMPPKLNISGTTAEEMSLTAAMEEIVPATIPGWFIPGVTDHKGLINQMQKVRPVDDAKKARLLTHLASEKPEIVKALEMFWKNRAGIETFASILMTICVKAGLMGSASRWLEYLENEKRTLGILPCERADLIAVSNAFDQGEKVETIIDMNERIGELIAWEHNLQKKKGMENVMGSTANFYGKASDLLDHLRNPTEKIPEKPPRR